MKPEITHSLTMLPEAEVMYKICRRSKIVDGKEWGGSENGRLFFKNESESF